MQPCCVMCLTLRTRVNPGEVAEIMQISRREKIKYIIRNIYKQAPELKFPPDPSVYESFTKMDDDELLETYESCKELAELL